MSLQTIGAFSLLGIGTAAAYYFSPSQPSPETPNPVKAISSPPKNSDDIADKLDRYYLLIKAAKKTLKWTNKGIKQAKFAIQSGVFTTSLSSWARSPKAIEVFVLIGGALILTGMNMKPLKPRDGFMQKTASLGWSLLGESKAILEAHGIMIALSKLARAPKSQILPFACAATMIIASHLMSK
jgi:hypothetical protein